ncbi:hypothetical protein, partial [Rhizobium leguminosarum]|uniref:hypothetical protein n=1 Tax=Rhizobium leguminosarum TaxID=384 RepID=UPI001C97DC18
ACLVLLQYADDLFVCETIALHPLVLSMGQSLLQNGLFQRGKVRGHHLCPIWFRHSVRKRRDCGIGGAEN